LPAFIKAQQYVPFPDSNAVWSEEEIDGMGPCQPCKYQFRMKGDTIIDSIQYHKIYKENDSLLNSSNLIYFGEIREQSKRIYYRCCNHDIRLYDFSKSVGDTIKNLYSEFSGCNAISDSATITNIDSILIDGNYRRVFHLNTYNNPVWIEGIGSINGLLNAVVGEPTCSCTWDLVCFQNNDSVKYLNPKYSTCFPEITGITNYTVVENTVSVLPNPVTDISEIQWSNSNEYPFSKLIIVDVLGKDIKYFNVSGISDITINRADFAQGIYFAKLYSLNGKYNVIKLIIQ
jgi:hypothetical protein